MGRHSKSSEKKKLREPQGLAEHFTLDYWHGLLPDEDTALLLPEDGDFLMRSVEGQGEENIFLSVRWGEDILSCTVKSFSNGQYDLNDKKFASIKQLIDFYQVRKKPLEMSDKKAVLGRPIHRKSWELRHHLITCEKELGSGAYGTVYKGLLQVANKKKPIEVAVKVLTEMGVEASNALWKEARVMREYDHPNVLKMYGVANDVMPFYLVMELVNGGSVDSFLEKEDKKSGASIKIRVEIITQAATGLEYLHSKSCIHRDIACRNLLIESKPLLVKVADFGMTRKSTNYRIDPNKPLNLRWLAPEVYETAIANKATDVYAFGVTMYECFTKPYDIPYSDWKANKVYEKVVNQGYRLQPTDIMPREIGELMDDCLGPEKSRPTFRTIMLFLRTFQKKSRQ